MKKKNKSFFTLDNILTLVAIILSVVAICMIFANFVELGAASSSFKISYEAATYSGIEAVFGKDGVFKFSFMNLLTYILVIVCLLICMLKIFGVWKNKSADIILTILFLISAIFFFCSGAFCVLEKTTTPIVNGITITKTIKVGAIVSGICMILCTACSAVCCFNGLNKRKKW